MHVYTHVKFCMTNVKERRVVANASGDVGYIISALYILRYWCMLSLKHWLRFYLIP